jgi:hypothetical protein
MSAARAREVAPYVGVLGEVTRSRHKMHARQEARSLTPEQIETLPPALSLQDGPWCLIEWPNGVQQFLAVKRLRSGIVLDVVCVQALPKGGVP